ncbi:iron-containing alcohol dehydrogenase [Defluviimonas sp. WL0002]|uniref:Iron-containing alcohol dehydrogenase n=1 Tax=Albidovulum marisflavi TaxID=2984159 RepID=A0ABT2ZC83_9RHOB|nr:iron-containing alcohol dehydrogenase [Defluviimonas sp. WL0002]MCV2868660.1 iron-containing alcohol dehydrogenase [Defluviimonas sp. WL0002]
MEPYGFASPRLTLFGRGCRTEAAAHIAMLGRKVLLVRGRSVAWAGDLRSGLEAAGLRVVETLAQGEPTVGQVRAALETCRSFGPDCVVAIGGGSVVDLAKALAALLPAGGDPLDYLEGVGKGLTLDPDPLPLVAIPTTAGTGAEATRNAVLGVPDRGLKISLRDTRMIPRLAIVDPALTDDAPRALTLATGLDALTQLIEAYLSIRANIVTDALCRDAAPKGIAALGRLMKGEDPLARDAMARASHLSGLALANAGLGIVHGLASVIGGRGGSHGAICGRLLPAALAVNERAARKAGLPTDRFVQVDEWLAQGLGGEVGRGSDCLRQFADAHGLPSLRALGCDAGEEGDIARAAMTASSTKGNPVRLDLEEIVDILARS